MKAIANLGELFDASSGTATAIIDRLTWDTPREASYEALDRYTDACARGLIARGLQRGDRVAVVSGNRMGFFIALFGILRAGLTAVPVNHKQPPETVEFLFEDADIRFAFCDPEREDLVPAACPRFVFDASSASDLGDFLDAGEFEPIEPAPGDAAFILYTSGSTGRPKGVPCTHGGQIWILKTRLGFAAPNVGRQRALIAAPLYHLNGLGSGMGMLAGGHTIVLHPGFDTRRYLNDLEHFRCTSVTAVPTMLAMALKETDLLDPKRYQSVRMLRVGSAPVTQSLLDRLAQIFTQAQFGNAYGITEGGQLVFGPHPDGIPVPPISCGWPVPGASLRIVDAEGRDAEEGALWIKSPAVMPGYLNLPDKSAEVLTADGWYRTSDLFRRDAQGFYYFIGRTDDMFVCGGSNIYPGEVESMLEHHPEIAQCSVVPVDDEIKWQKPVAFIVRRPGSTLSEKAVQDYALRHAPAYHHPRKVWFVDALPLAGTNKIDRKALTARAAQLWKESAA
jgi:long-chain acyl-CoA synthetase